MREALSDSAPRFIFPAARLVSPFFKYPCEASDRGRFSRGADRNEKHDRPLILFQLLTDGSNPAILALAGLSRG